MRIPPQRGINAQRVEEIVVEGEQDLKQPARPTPVAGSGVEPRLSTRDVRHAGHDTGSEVPEGGVDRVRDLGRRAGRSRGITAGRAEDQDGSDGKDGGAT